MIAQRRLAIGGFALLGLLLLATGLTLLFAPAYLRLPPETFEPLRALSCQLPPFCALAPLPFTFGLAFALVVGGAVLIGASLWLARERLAPAFHNVLDWRWTTQLQLPRARRRFVMAALALGALIALGAAIITALNHERRLPDTLPWALALVLTGALIWNLDRANGRRAALTPREVVLALVFLSWLLTLAVGFRAVAPDDLTTRAIIVGLGALLALALYQSQRLRAGEAALLFSVIAAFAIYTYDLTSWRYAFIGDEYAHFDSAYRTLAFGSSLHPLDWRGVYENAPALSIYVQSFALWLFGADVYGWRTWQIVVVTLTALPLYGFVRAFAPTRAAVVAVVIFLGAHHLIGFSKGGYSQLECLPPFAGALAFAAGGIRRKSLLALYLAGALSLAGFYTFGLTLPLAPLVALVPVLAYRPQLASGVIAWLRELPRLLPLALVFTLGALLLALPRLTDTAWIEKMATQSISDSEQQTENVWTEQVLPNTFYTLLAPLTFSRNTHYVSWAHLDPVSALLFVIGLAALPAARHWISLWLPLSLVAAAFVLGGLGRYDYPANTRTFVLVPFYAVGAAVGVEALRVWLTVLLPQRIKSKSLQRAGRVAGSMGLIAIVALNLYHFRVITEADMPRTATAALIQQVQEIPPEARLFHIWHHVEDATILLVWSAFGYDPERIVWIDKDDPDAGLAQIATTVGEGARGDRVLIAASLPNMSYWLDAFALAPGWTGFEVRDAAGALHYYGFTRAENQ